MRAQALIAMRTVCAAFEALHSASLEQQSRQNRFCNIEPSLVTDSSEASKGREASDDTTAPSRRLGQALQARAVQLRLGRARCGQPHETRK